MSSALPLLNAADNRGPGARPLVVTGAADLLDDLLRLAAAAGVAVTVADGTNAVCRAWASAPLVLVGMDRVASCVAAGLPDRRHVVLIGGRVDDSRVWDGAQRIGAEHVIFLPEAEPWLVDLLGDLDRLDRRGARILGVLGGHRAAGASTVAVSLALSGLHGGLRTMLIDADPSGGGLTSAFARLMPPAGPGGGIRDPADLLAGLGAPPAADVPGMPMTWADLLPRRGDLSIVSWNATISPTVPPPTLATLLSTASRTTDLVIVDLPATVDPAASVALRTCETVLVVTAADPADALRTARVRATAVRHCPDVRAIVRVRPRDELSAASVASMLDMPLAGVLPDRRPQSTSARGPGRGHGDEALRRLGEDLLSGLAIHDARPWPDREDWS